jgi:hypothetical protein
VSGLARARLHRCEPGGWRAPGGGPGDWLEGRRDRCSTKEGFPSSSSYSTHSCRIEYVASSHTRALAYIFLRVARMPTQRRYSADYSITGHPRLINISRLYETVQSGRLDNASRFYPLASIIVSVAGSSPLARRSTSVIPTESFREVSPSSLRSDASASTARLSVANRIEAASTGVGCFSRLNTGMAFPGDVDRP